MHIQYNLSVSTGMSRKLFSQFSAVFIGIKNRKETILIPTSVNFAWHKVRLIVQVQKYCFLFGEVIGIFLSDCNTVETWQHAMDSSYQVIYSNCWTWNHFCLAPRNLSKSRGLSISPVTTLLISLPRYSVEAFLKTILTFANLIILVKHAYLNWKEIWRTIQAF